MVVDIPDLLKKADRMLTFYRTPFDFLSKFRNEANVIETSRHPPA